MASNIVIHPESGLPAVHAAGELRVCGLLPLKGPSKRFPLFGAEAPLDPTTLPARFSLRQFVGDIKDQKSTSACAGYSGAGALETKLRYMGCNVPALSGAFAYSWCNNGRDQGANPEDVMNAMEAHGVCPEADNPWTSIFSGQVTAQAIQDAQRWKLADAHLIPDPAQIVAALGTNEIVAYGIDLGANFQPDANGIIPPYMPDRQLAGHGLYAVGWDSPFKDRLEDPAQAVIETVNSWTRGWGLRGLCYVPMSYFYGQMFIAYSVQGVALDPQDPGLPPDPA